MNTLHRTRPVIVILLLGIMLLAASPAIAAPARQGSIHIVQPGENLSSIAAYYGVDLWTLAATNGIANTDWIYVGQRLTIPGVSSNVASNTDGNTHVVTLGQNLSSIAAYYGVNLWTLASVNGISDPNQIYVGQRLIIPGGAAASQPAVTASPLPATRPATSSADRWIDVNSLLTRATRQFLAR